MADLKKKISELTLGTPSDIAVIPYVEGGETKKAYKSDLEGADGTDGKTVLNGSIDPTTEGVDGDFYINTTSWQIFGPKATIWGVGTDIIGDVGNGIASIELLSGDHSSGTLDTYRITYTDSTTFDYQVYNGADGAGIGDMMKAIYDPANGAKQVAFSDELTAKQNTLISGTNIKTINGESVLGSGNIVISGGSGAWELLVSTTQSLVGTTLNTPTFTAKKYLKILVNSKFTLANNLYIRFNGDSGANYGYYIRDTTNAVLNTSNDTQLRNSITGDLKGIGEFIVNNISGQNKGITINYHSYGTGATAKPYNFGGGVWNNTAQITSVGLVVFGGNIDVETNITVLGMN